MYIHTYTHARAHAHRYMKRANVVSLKNIQINVHTNMESNAI